MAKFSGYKAQGCKFDPSHFGYFSDGGEKQNTCVSRLAHDKEPQVVKLNLELSTMVRLIAHV